LHFDEALVGFESAERPTARYGPNDSILVKEFDTAVPSRANTSHTFGSDLCPDTAGLDPTRDRREIETRLLGSRVGALLAYLKTLWASVRSPPPALPAFLTRISCPSISRDRW
jgi:hypothetical protein